MTVASGRGISYVSRDLHFDLRCVRDGNFDPLVHVPIAVILPHEHDQFFFRVLKIGLLHRNRIAQRRETLGTLFQFLDLRVRHWRHS